MQRFKQSKLLFSTALVFHVRLFCNQFTHNTLQVRRTVTHFHWDLIIAWTWTNRFSIGTHVAYLCSCFISMNPVDGPYYIFYDGWQITITLFSSQKRFQIPDPLRQGNLRIIDLGNLNVFLSLIHLLNSQAYGATWSTRAADLQVKVISVSIRYAGFVFRSREACHPMYPRAMVNTRPPKTFLFDHRLDSRYIKCKVYLNMF